MARYTENRNTYLVIIIHGYHNINVYNNVKTMNQDLAVHVYDC